MSKEPPAAGPFADFVCFSVYSANLAFNRLYKGLLDQYGLTYPQYLVLLALRARDGQTVGELGEALHLESSTLTPLLKRMEAADLLNRTRDMADERVVRISLTQQGLAKAQAMDCVPGDVLAATGFQPDELSKLSAGLQLLAQTLRERTA